MSIAIHRSQSLQFYRNAGHLFTLSRTLRHEQWILNVYVHSTNEERKYLSNVVEVFRKTLQHDQMQEKTLTHGQKLAIWTCGNRLFEIRLSSFFLRSFSQHLYSKWINRMGFSIKNLFCVIAWMDKNSDNRKWCFWQWDSLSLMFDRVFNDCRWCRSIEMSTSEEMNQSVFYDTLSR